MFEDETFSDLIADLKKYLAQLLRRQLVPIVLEHVDMTGCLTSRLRRRLSPFILFRTSIAEPLMARSFLEKDGWVMILSGSEARIVDWYPLSRSLRRQVLQCNEASSPNSQADESHWLLAADRNSPLGL